MTADGKIATANRAVSSFSSPRDREHMMELRATADAIMNGARTADLNPITMGPGPAKYRQLRLKRGLAEYNLRVIVSGSGTVDPNAEVFKQKFSPILILTTGRAGAKRLRALRAVATEVKVFGKAEINFAAALRWLRRKWNVGRLLCEGGGEINDALFRAGLVDELHLTICPKIFGGRAAPTISEGRGVKRLRDAAQMRLHSARRHGDELFLIFRKATPRTTARAI
jgi:riboflavin-specific deaminase-like protein